MTIGQLDRHLARATAARARRGLEAGEAYDRRDACGSREDAAGKRLFALSGRKDFQGFVFEEMLELGLCPVEAWDQLAGAEGGRRVDFYFGEQFESPDAPRAYWAHGLRLSRVLRNSTRVKFITNRGGRRTPRSTRRGPVFAPLAPLLAPRLHWPRRIPEATHESS